MIFTCGDLSSAVIRHNQFLIQLYVNILAHKIKDKLPCSSCAGWQRAVSGKEKVTEVNYEKGLLSVWRRESRPKNIAEIKAWKKKTRKNQRTVESELICHTEMETGRTRTIWIKLCKCTVQQRGGKDQDADCIGCSKILIFYYLVAN